MRTVRKVHDAYHLHAGKPPPPWYLTGVHFDKAISSETLAFSGELLKINEKTSPDMTIVIAEAKHAS